VSLKIGDLLSQHLAAANVLGRSHIAKEVHRKTGKIIPINTSSHLHVRFDDDDLSAGFAFDLPSDISADYLRNLTPVTKATYDGLSTQYQRDAFTVAGVSDTRLIAKIRDDLAQVLLDGGTQKDFDQAVDKLTTTEGVEKIAAFTLDTVFTTNMQKAYSLGRFEQLNDPAVKEALPFWQYLTVGDDRVRPEHAVLDHFTALCGDAVWFKIYPPNGFNCRCIVIALLAEEAPEDARESGMARLPLLAVAKVPQPGFSKVFAPAA
jgi:SPP1 gp7 family putative phage head morphogenesis protein